MRSYQDKEGSEKNSRYNGEGFRVEEMRGSEKNSRYNGQNELVPGEQRQALHYVSAEEHFFITRLNGN